MIKFIERSSYLCDDDLIISSDYEESTESVVKPTEENQNK